MSALSGQRLLETLKYLSDTIGPRPPGSLAEEQARQYLEQELNSAGIDSVERIAFPTIDSWGWGLITPVAVIWLGCLLGRFGPVTSLIGCLLILVGIYNYWMMLNSNVEKQWFYPFYKKHPGATLIARLPAQETQRQRVVLIGHTDTNKNRVTFSTFARQTLLTAPLSLLIAAIIAIAAILLHLEWLRLIAEMYLLVGLTVHVVDEMEEFVDGANDNASAVAAVLGLGKHIKANPLKHTEVWLAFTGSEEVGLVGMNALLDKHGDELRDAYFIDFELIGNGQTIYVAEHSGFSPFSSYQPDQDSVQLAERAIEVSPELGVYGHKMVMNEEVSTLRQRGFRGICLVGVDESGWPTNWHRLTDTSHYINPASLETAARFAYAMITELEKRA